MTLPLSCSSHSVLVPCHCGQLKPFYAFLNLQCLSIYLLKGCRLRQTCLLSCATLSTFFACNGLEAHSVLHPYYWFSVLITFRCA
uniref:Uncharacterized protein n=1 Tax=Arundo donax TaxID=35708 RepID=A0A0A9FSQ5_ARUDO